MTTETETILYSKSGSVAHIVLNRPRRINAYNMQMRDEMYQALEAVRDDPEVRVAILRGAGERGFCAGADLSEFGTAPSQVVARQVRWERDIWGLFLSIEKPLIAALHGYVIGSGVEMACLCDIRIASEDAVFSMPEVALGMVPAAGGSQTLPRIIGQGPALEMLLTNQRITAPDALRMGLVHSVVPNDTLLEEAERVAQLLASRKPEILAAVKTALLDGMDMPLASALELEERLAFQIMR
ncbi:MAG: enoyl-CoA hydratase/isomerase family protein [Chloroflexi bacterium]|nr:enoyl-CoA hydratase/isomerase family protein [Chloroflexota bacterium]